jgi:hypothetical protein
MTGRPKGKVAKQTNIQLGSPNGGRSEGLNNGEATRSLRSSACHVASERTLASHLSFSWINHTTDSSCRGYMGADPNFSVASSSNLT